jgi:phospholipase/carboxylesterase
MKRVALLLLCLFACHKQIAVEEAGIHFVKVYAQGADDTSPLLVWLHGRGGSAARFEEYWRRFPGKIEVALPQGPIPFAQGYAWFEWPADDGSGDALAKAMLDAEEKVWVGIAAEAHGRKVLVGGFSQGAMIAYALAARHPEIVYSFPIAGLLPAQLVPKDKPTAPVFAMHGTDDHVVEVEHGRAAVEAFRAAGGKAELQEFPGVGHEIAPAMRQELVRRVQTALPALQ